MAILLSFRIISRLLGVEEALFNPSKARPPLMEPSPITATTWRLSSPFRAAATAIPNAAEIEFDACPHVKYHIHFLQEKGKDKYHSTSTIGTETVTTASQNLMSVCLMSYIPNDTVVRSLVHIMKSHSQLYHPKLEPKCPGLQTIHL